MKKYYIILLLILSSISFGADVSINQAVSNTAITIANQYPNYPATPGDIYDISFLTAGSGTSTLLTGFVDNNYNIDLSFIGKVNVKDLIYSEVQDTLKKKISSAYPGSIINVLIKAPGKFNVTLLGEVTESQTLDSMSLTSLAEILLGKTTPFASFRNIEIRSEDGTIAEYDLFKYRRFADLKNNPFLKPNDIITVRTYEKMVKIQGQVKRPGAYQLKESDNLETLINLYSNGFTKLAQKSNIEIKRIIEIDGEYNDTTLYIDASSRDLSSVELSDYDTITINNRAKFNPTVVIQGAISTDVSAVGSTVSNRVPVSITSHSRVSTVINQMPGSFNLTSSLQEAFILRGDEKIQINISEVMTKEDSEYNVVMKDKDILVIPFKHQVVYVAGSVNSSGTVPFIENRTAEYYIGAAGGYNIEENLFRSYSVRDVYGNKIDKHSIISPEDLIWVNKNHPMAYIDEYGGWIVTIGTIISSAIIIEDWTKSLQ